MINLYVMNVSPFEDSSLFSKGLALIDKERQDKVNTLKHKEAQKLSLGAGLLLMFGLNYALETGTFKMASSEMKCSEKEQLQFIEFEADELVCHLAITDNVKSFEYTYGEHGKPYIAGDTPIFFSLSHSGEYVFLAVSDKEVGADIQKCKDISFDRTAKHFMTQGEYAQWSEESEEVQKELFYQIWAGKEAYLKLTGEGMTAGFQTVYYDDDKQTMIDSRMPDKEVETFWGVLAGYQFAVCQ